MSDDNSGATFHFGSFSFLGDTGVHELRHIVQDIVGDYADDYDLDAIEADYREAVGECLPEGLTLCGEEIYGPYPQRFSFDVIAFREALEEIDTNTILARHEKH